MNCTYSDSNQKKIEIYSVVIYSLYAIAFVMLSGWRGNSQWKGIAMISAMLLSWIVYVGRFRTYAFRATFYVLMMQFNLILQAISLESFSRSLPVLMVFVVLVSLYGIPELIYIPSAGIMIVLVIHVFVLKNMDDIRLDSYFGIFALLLNTVLMVRVIYTSTKMNKAGSEQLLGVIDELERVEQSKDDFLANVSHEIRTPLNTICGMSDVLLQKELPDSVQEDVQSIQISGRMLKSVVSDILDFSELLSGKIELEEEAYSITSTINDVINMTSARRGNKPIELIVDCDANIPCTLYGDEKKLRRVIMNLIDNAIKFTEEGCISLTVGFRKESYGINLLIAVKDTGIGMDEKNQEQLFTGFKQGDNGRNRHVGGLGLGLAISKALVQKMGGAITVKSRLGKGTRIRFTIPVKVLDETPIVSLRDRDKINVAVYIDMEQFVDEMVRDEYEHCILRMVEQLKGKCHICRNLAELQRWEKRENLSHVFISDTEYFADRSYFDGMAERTNLVVVLDRASSGGVLNPKVIKIYKPLYILSIASVLNGMYEPGSEARFLINRKFTAEDAHVLVVDDNRMNIMVIEALLSNYRIKVSTALSGAEALDKITAENFDFVFMDHMMPEMDGVETLHRIRHLVGSYYRKVPVIALTANAVPGARDMFLAEGFQDFIEKPVEISVLERLLKRMIPEEKIVYQEYSDEPVSYEETIAESPEGVHSLEQFGLDVQSGLMYCNGEKYYIKILQNLCSNAEESGSLANRLFREKDWNNYIITVHGIKGAMRSIGANEVSELAKELEFAGREGRIGYILEHHDKMIQEYNRLVDNLRGEKWLFPENVEESKQNATEMELTDLDEAQFGEKIEQMEKAVYAIDEETFLSILDELKTCRYCQIALHSVLSPVQKEAENASYFSAVELLAEIKASLEKQKEG